MSKMLEEILADGSRFVGNGRTGLVFYPDGNVVFRHGRAGERKALTKNFSTEVSALDRNGKPHALSFMDFVDPHDGFGPELAALTIAAGDLEDDADSKRCHEAIGLRSCCRPKVPSRPLHNTALQAYHYPSRYWRVSWAESRPKTNSAGLCILKSPIPRKSRGELVSFAPRTIWTGCRLAGRAVQKKKSPKCRNCLKT